MTEEYEREELDKLKEDLKDINTYTTFKNGTYIYDLGYYQGRVLVDEIESLKEIINVQGCQLEELRKQKTDYTEVNILEMQKNLYKQRIDKAIEYIEDDLTLTDGFMICEDRAKELLNILKGEDK